MGTFVLGANFCIYFQFQTFVYVTFYHRFLVDNWLGIRKKNDLFLFTFLCFGNLFINSVGDVC